MRRCPSCGVGMAPPNEMCNECRDKGRGTGLLRAASAVAEVAVLARDAGQPGDRRGAMRNYMQRNCPRCGLPRSGRHYTDGCKVDGELFKWLHDFALANGRNWRAVLRGMWMTDRDVDSPMARQARNIIGPTRIAKVRP